MFVLKVNEYRTHNISYIEKNNFELNPIYGNYCHLL